MYTPPLDDGTLPSDKLRELEVAMNNAFDSYREMYFEGGVSSVYLWDLEDVGFAGVVLMKKGEREKNGALQIGLLRVLFGWLPHRAPIRCGASRLMGFHPRL